MKHSGDTIVALSSGAPPAAIGVIRISGSRASEALALIGGPLPKPRRASVRTLRDLDGSVLDEALVLWFPGPGTATGEDSVELHCHGGRAVIAAIEQALLAIEGIRRAEPGEFTRRAFVNGKMDLAQAEGLADLLFAETEIQRRILQSAAGGALSQLFEGWRSRLLALAAQVEAILDFDDEDDVGALADSFFAEVQSLRAEIEAQMGRPRTERLRDGVRVVLAGPPNAGKSTIFNAILQTEAAIVSPVAGTTRDVLERSVAVGGIPFTLVDTAGLHDASEDEIEQIGIERALSALAGADIVLWLGPEGRGPAGAWEVETMIDVDPPYAKVAPRLRLSARSGVGLDRLLAELIAEARNLLPKPGEHTVNARQHECLGQAAGALAGVSPAIDLLVVAEQLRSARVAFDKIMGRVTTEDMLDTLFGRFCIGK